MRLCSVFLPALSCDTTLYVHLILLICPPFPLSLHVPLPSEIPISYLNLHKSGAHFKFCLYQETFLDFPSALGFASVAKKRRSFFFPPHSSVLYPIIRKIYISDWPNSSLFIGRVLLRLESFYFQRHVSRGTSLSTLSFILQPEGWNWGLFSWK